MSISEVIPAERIQGRIIVLRGVRVLLDSDLAELYEVPTKQLNQQVKRNADKFPEDFMFRLTAEEIEAVQRSRSQFVTLNEQGDSRSQTATLKNVANLKSQNATSRRGQNIKYLPYAFTEHGAIQAANVLNSSAAVQMSVQVVRAFVSLRQLMVNHKALSSKLTQLENRLGEHDEQIAALLEAIRELAAPVLPADRRKIGYHEGNR